MKLYGFFSMFRLIIFILLFIISNRAFTQPTLELNEEEIKYFGKYTSILKDTSNQLRIDEVIQLNNQFKSWNQPVFTQSESEFYFWVKFKVKNLITKECFLVIDNPYIYDLEVFSVKGDQTKLLTRTGGKHHFYTRKISRNNFVISLDVSEGEEKTYFIRYRSHRGQLPLIIGSADKLFERFELADLLWGIFYGVFLVIIIYNLILFFALWDIAYLAYSLYFFLFGFSRSILTGYSFQYLYPSHSFINDFEVQVVIISIIANIWFSLVFLKVKQFSPWIYYVGLTIICFYSILFIFSWIDNNLAFKISTQILLLIVPYFVVAGFVVYKNNYFPARYYLIASALFFISVIINTMRLLNILPTNVFTIHIIQFGVVIEAILFSLALGDRYKMFKEEKENYQKELNKELKIKIIERIKSQKNLNKINKSLEQRNLDLDNFIYVASHDLKGPIYNIEGIVQYMISEENQTQENKKFYELILASVSKFKNTVNDLTEVSRVQKLREELKEDLNVQELIEKVIKELKSEIDISHAEIKTDIKEVMHIYFSRENFEKIIDHLLSNALKFRDPDRRLIINIKTSDSPDYHILSVEDNGLGIKKEYRSKIFSMFKKAHNEKSGRGIGLYIIKRIIENEGGKIEVESEVGKGSIFKVYFKK